jgi:F-type H+-transporting ATPase subunit a
MRRLTIALLLTTASAPWAMSEEPSTGPAHSSAKAESTSHAAHDQENPDVAEYIFHHVADSNELEFEIPLNTSRPNPVIHLPVIRIPLRAGACPADRHQVGSLAAGCLDLSITKHVVMMWLAALLLVATFLFGANRDKQQLVPRGAAANLLEMLVLFVRDELAIKNIGKEEGPRYTPFLLTAFFFILFMNLIGLFPWLSTPTSNLAVTCGLALCTFALTQAAGIRAAGVLGYLKHLTGGVAVWLWPIMVPVEILGLFTKPFALTVRLFANMLAGHIVIFFLIGLIFIMRNVAFAAVSVPFALGIYFLELFVALVQAYVFVMLSSLFIGMGVAMGHHDQAHPEAEGAHSHDHGEAQMLGS